VKVQISAELRFVRRATSQKNLPQEKFQIDINK
jgi:hypothetical protein